MATTPAIPATRPTPRSTIPRGGAPLLAAAYGAVLAGTVLGALLGGVYLSAALSPGLAGLLALWALAAAVVAAAPAVARLGVERLAGTAVRGGRTARGREGAPPGTDPGTNL